MAVYSCDNGLYETNNFSEEQLETINELIEWIHLLQKDPECTNRLKIWKRLRLDGADSCLLLEAFIRTGLFNKAN